jgi:CheY-like chemotaxis protein
MSERVKILVVDDDPSLLDLLIETLNTVGYEARGVPGAAEALDILKDTMFQLVITDIKMPGMDGFTLAERIHRDYPELPVIFITGVFTSQVLQKGKADNILTKPFRIGQLEQMIKQSLMVKEDKPPDREQILVVDDDDSFRLMLSETLKLSDYEVIGAASGEEAMDILNRGNISAVITDLKMPGMDGMELARQIKNNWKDLPVIIVTAYLSQEQAAEYFEAIDGYLMKPFRIESITELLESLKSQIEHHS